jgi:hypothetical protein
MKLHGTATSNPALKDALEQYLRWRIEAGINTLWALRSTDLYLIGL